MWMWTIATALAATPLPDRPLISRTGELAAAYTLEMELGASFADGPTRSVPAAFKYSLGGAAEPRIMTNLGAFENGHPQLEAGLKIRLFAAEEDALSMWLASRIPVADAEPWRGEWHALYTSTLATPLVLRVNGGLDFIEDGEGSITFGGTPLTGALILNPVGGFSMFGELAGRAGGPGCEGLSCAYGDLRFTVGTLITVTEVLVLDAAIGYSTRASDAVGTVGITSNFGRIH